MLKPSNWKSRRSVRRSVNDKVCDEVWDEVWDDTRKGRAVHQPPRIVKSRTRTRTRTKKPRKGRTFPQPSVSRGQSARPYLLLLSMPRHTSSLSLSHALSSTLRRKTLSRLLSPIPISTQKRLSCPCYTRYPDSQPIPITSRPIQISPHKPRSAHPLRGLQFGIDWNTGIRVSCLHESNHRYSGQTLPARESQERTRGPGGARGGNDTVLCLGGRQSSSERCPGGRADGSSLSTRLVWCRAQICPAREPA